LTLRCSEKLSQASVVPMEGDRVAEPVARQDEVPEGVAGIVAVAAAVVGNAEGALADCNKEAPAADSNIAAVDTLAVRNTGTEAVAMGGRTGQKQAAGRAVALEDLAVVAVAVAALAAAALAGPDAFEEVDTPPGRTRRPPR